MGLFFSSNEEKPPQYLGVPLMPGTRWWQQEGTAPLGSHPFLKLPSLPWGQGYHHLPSQSGSHGQAGCQAPTKCKQGLHWSYLGQSQNKANSGTGRLGPRPVGGSRTSSVPPPTQFLLCWQHRDTLTLPFSRDPWRLPTGQLCFKVLQNIQKTHLIVK